MSAALPDAQEVWGQVWGRLPGTKRGRSVSVADVLLARRLIPLFQVPTTCSGAEIASCLTPIKTEKTGFSGGC